MKDWNGANATDSVSPGNRIQVKNAKVAFDIYGNGYFVEFKIPVSRTITITNYSQLLINQ